MALSDLAAAGASPLALSTSVEAPPEMDVSDFGAFFEGISEICAEYEVHAAGGNLREATTFSCHGTAIGIVEQGLPLGRKTSEPGDLIYSVGECGLFAATYVRALKHGLDSVSDQDLARLLRPRPKVREMRILTQHRLIKAASDNTDGVLGTVWNLASASNCSVELELDDSVVPPAVFEAASEIEADPWNLMFFWGDWHVIVAVASENREDFERLVKAEDIPCQFLGRVLVGPPRLFAVKDGHRAEVTVIRNESFSDSAYCMRPQEHVASMLHKSFRVGSVG